MTAHLTIPRFCKYALGNFAAGIGFLALWSMLLWMDSKLIPLLVLGFPALMFVGFAFLWSLRGWRQVVPGIFCWLLIWVVVYAVGVELLFQIAGSP
jgi:hypothetical protein